MKRDLRLRRIYEAAISLAAVLGFALPGCGPNGVLGHPNNNANSSDNTAGGAATDTTSAKSFVSPGGTAGLSIGSTDTGVAALAVFDPGAFVLNGSTSTSASDSVAPAQMDGGAPPPPPPPPPPDGGGTPPPPDGSAPPPTDGATQPPPSGGTQPPPSGGTQPPPSGGTQPPPPVGSQPPPTGGSQPPPPGGTQPPPTGGTMPPPPDGSQPPPSGTQPPPSGGTNQPPPQGTTGASPPPPPIPGLAPPPGGTPPPPPPPGFEQFGSLNFNSADFQNFANQFIPPPGGTPSSPGTPGAPPSDGTSPPGATTQPPPTFATFPFADYLQSHPIQDIIPNAPPKFDPGAAFGQFAFGSVPPPPPGFPPFPPPPPAGTGAFGAFPPPPAGTPGAPPSGTTGGSPTGTPSVPPSGPPTPGVPAPPPPPGFQIGAPPGLPPGLPNGFYAFHDSLSAMHDFLGTLPPPTPGTPSGSNGGATGTPPPGQPGTLGGGIPGLPFNVVDFATVAEYLPPTFLPPEQVTGVFESFGAGHPLIGEGGEVNPELETALAEHPPAPTGFDKFDFVGDTGQFDDMFSVYDAQTVGTTKQGQVNSTYTAELDDGSTALRSDTTVLEAIPGQATPLILMEAGVYQTQWVVDIHEITSSHVFVEHPDDPGNPTEFDTNREVFSQMTWTMLIKEIDDDGDGVVDRLETSGANTVAVLDAIEDGSAPDGLPPIPPPPDLLLSMQFQGVLQTGEAATTPPQETADKGNASGSAEGTAGESTLIVGTGGESSTTP